ncbi:MAG: deoxyribonuclease IV [candidate division KSB1 bacterium]|nr:deoxyribonuclease IV [candidate division KSB1 bacterium]MDZ7275001.1 deoxyribonuclease IV [candidate division KSB1 bacterium]MDZ7286550.1 deoxyribonuclease IV [candidate division KSB1 bacterium]MDZ7299286.1 deoxyribonuclease IV [candidate division KSB1 bacterium]MDZ7307375.1 deoxyribonuclease IV [candidate division KSB1 bacterium]
MILGAHLSIAGGLSLAPARARAIGGEALQIFSRNQRQWRARPLGAAQAAGFCQAVKAAGLRALCTHASYLINLAAPEAGLWQKSIRTLADELARAERLGIAFVVVHPGAHKGRGREAGWQRVAAAVSEAFDRSATRRVRLLLENTAGQGSYLGSTLEELAMGLALAGRRVGICLDTCHLFAAGYDFSSAAAYRRLRRRIAATVGLSRVQVLHLNDSAKPPGSHLDQHAGIGRGLIGAAAFAFWVNDPAWANTPGILETPGGERNYRREVRLLRAMNTAAGTVPAANP